MAEVLLDPETGTLTWAGRESHLPPNLCRVARLLLASGGRVVKRSDMLTAIGYNGKIATKAHYHTISRLRPILPGRIVAVRGFDGYIWHAPTEEPHG